MSFAVGIVVTVLTYSWVVAPRVPRAFAVVPAAIVLALTAWHAVRTEEWGIAPRALAPGLRAAALLTLPACAALLGAGAALGTLHDRRDLLATFVSLVVWGTAQQWALQTVVLREAQRASSRRGGVAIAAAVFGALHLPNPFLTAVTAIAALGWCTIYDRHSHVVPLGLSHAIGTLAVLYAFDNGVTGRLRVGAAYLLLGG